MGFRNGLDKGGLEKEDGGGTGAGQTGHEGPEAVPRLNPSWTALFRLSRHSVQSRGRSCCRRRGNGCKLHSPYPQSSARKSKATPCRMPGVRNLPIRC